MRRPRGTGRIYRQKDSSIWWIKYYRNGEPFRESTGTSDKRKATRALNLRLAEVTTGKFIGPPVERTRVTELAEEFLRDYRINGKASLDDCEARWRLRIQPFFGSLRAVQITSISGFRDPFIAGLIPSADLLHRWADEEHFVGCTRRIFSPSTRKF